MSGGIPGAVVDAVLPDLVRLVVVRPQDVGDRRVAVDDLEADAVALLEAIPALFACLGDPASEARIEQAIVFSGLAWDWNCSQHIPKLVVAA